MIARVWSGVAHAGDAGDIYAAHVETHVVPALRALAGFRGAQVLRRRAADGDRFIVTTFWARVDDIRAFAGDDVEAAVVAADARRVLARFDERAVHYEVTTYAAAGAD